MNCNFVGGSRRRLGIFPGEISMKRKKKQMDEKTKKINLSIEQMSLGVRLT